MCRHCALGLWIISLSLALTACGRNGPPAVTESAPTLPAPTRSATASATATPSLTTPPTPDSGDWGGPADFGRLVFTVEPGGEAISVMRLQLSKWECGSMKLLSRTTDTGVEVPISGGAFSASRVEFTAGIVMDVSGTYDPSSRTFSGHWSATEYGSSCSGTWHAAALGPATPTPTLTPTPVITPVPGLDQVVLRPPTWALSSICPPRQIGSRPRTRSKSMGSIIFTLTVNRRSARAR